MATRKLFPFLNEIREPIRDELLRRRGELTTIVSPFARFTSMKAPAQRPDYQYFHIGLQSVQETDRSDLIADVFELSYGSRDVVGFGYNGTHRVPISIENAGIEDVSEGTHPVPGVVSIHLEHKGANEPVFWDVKWVCFNVGQLEFLRQHFMIAGSYVALEYGQYYAGADGAEFADLNNRISENQFNWARTNAHEELFELVNAGRAAMVERFVNPSGGNYDLWVGQIVDFEIDIREDGAYECTTRVYSTGEALFSIATHTPIFPSVDEESEETLLTSAQLISEYFKPVGGLEQLIRAMSIWQGENNQLLVVNTTSEDLEDKLRDDKELQRQIEQLPIIKDRIERARESGDERIISRGGRAGGVVQTGDVEAEGASAVATEKNFRYFGDAQWFVRFQTFIDRILPDLLFWFEAANVRETHLEAFENVNFPTKAELSRREYAVWKAPRPFENFPEPSGPTHGFVRETPTTVVDIERPDPTDVVGTSPYLMSIDPSVMVLRATGQARDRVVHLAEVEKKDGERPKCAIDNTTDMFDENSSNNGFAYLSEGVWINVNAIQEAFLSATTIHQGFVNLLRKMNAATGHYWNLDLVYDEELRQYNVVDMGMSTTDKEEVKNKAYEFNYRQFSEVMQMTFSAKMSKEVKTLVMLTANNANRSAYGSSIYGLVLNRTPLIDLYAQKEAVVNRRRRQLAERRRGQVISAADQEVGATEKTTATDERSHYTLPEGETVGSVYREKIFENFDDALRKYIAVPGLMVPAITEQGKVDVERNPSVPNNYIAPIPTEITMDLTIRGVGGLAFHDIFIVDKLPDLYREKGVFLVSGLSHDLTAEGWTTHISGLYYFMWPDPSDIPGVRRSGQLRRRDREELEQEFEAAQQGQTTFESI